MTESQLLALQKKGLIKGFTSTKMVKPVAKVKGVIPHHPKRSKEKDWIWWNLQFIANSNSLELVEEYKFHPERKWRSDWAIPAIKLLIEYEGLISDKSRHTTIKGYSNDSTKYREAVKLGWSLLRYDALNYKNLPNDIQSIIDGKRNMG